MNVANRFVVAALAAAAALACLTALAAMMGVAPDPSLFGGATNDIFTTLAGLGGASAVLWALLFVALFLVSAAIVGLEIRPGGPPPFLVVSTETGDVTVERRTARDFVEHVALGVSGVRSVTATVRLRGDGLVVRLRALVETRAVLTELGEALRETIIEKVEGQLSLPVEHVDVRVRMRPRRVRKPVVK